MGHVQHKVSIIRVPKKLFLLTLLHVTITDAAVERQDILWASTELIVLFCLIPKLSRLVNA